LNTRVRNVIIRMVISIIVFIYISYLAWKSLPRSDFMVIMAFFALFLGWSIIEMLIYKDPDTVAVEDGDRRSYLFLQLSSLLALFYALIDFLDYHHYTRMWSFEPWIIYAGFLVFILNTILRYNAITTLGKYYNPRVAIYQEHSLVTTGVYKKIRHPMYLSALLNIVAIAFIFSSWGTLLIMLFAVLPAVIYRINIEEEFLLTRLGNEYQQYLEKSKKIIPGIW
jgi:protein-S-isoprenylcysteine O-methyltransferase Ste14